VSEVVRAYESFLLAKSAAAEAQTPAAAGSPTAPVPPSAEAPRSPARLADVVLLPAAGSPADPPLYRCGEPLALDVGWESDDPGRPFHVAVGVNRSDGVEVFSVGTHADGLPPFSGELRYRVRLLIPGLPLVKGEFTLYIFLLDEGGLHVYDQRMIRRAFAVESPSYTFGLVRVEHRWELDVARPAAVHQAGR
jgi:hypothetical protein